MENHVSIPIKDVRPGMFYQNMLITAVEFAGGICILWFSSEQKLTFAINSWIAVSIYDTYAER